MVAGGVAARSPGDWGAPEWVSTAGKVAFLGGWMTLAHGVAKQSGDRTEDHIKAHVYAAAVIAGAMMIRKKEIAGGLHELPGWAPPAAFGLAWTAFVLEANKGVVDDASPRLLAVGA